jgi:hypothetical protein
VYNIHDLLQAIEQGVVAMPKRSSSGRSGSQRQRTRTQKSIELLRPTSEEDTTEAVKEQQQVKESVATATATPEISQSESSEPDSEATASSEPVETSKSESASERKPEAGSRSKAGAGSGSKKSSSSTLTPTSTAATPETVSSRAGSASARIAAKRQATQRPQRAVSLITPEHFTYVRRDLIFIAILAVIMIAAIITLYLVLGR